MTQPICWNLLAGREVCDKAGGGRTGSVLEKRCPGHLYKNVIEYIYICNILLSFEKKHWMISNIANQFLHPLCLDLLISPCLDLGKYDNKISANKKSCIDRCTEEGDGCVGVAWPKKSKAPCNFTIDVYLLFCFEG